jgi:hypothetical protein
MKLRQIASLAGVSIAAAAIPLAVLLPAGTAQAQEAPGHVILKAGGGTIALATTGKLGSPVYAGKYRASNHAEDWGKDNEMGGSFPGGRFGFFWRPGGTRTNLYVHAGSTSYLVNGGVAATIFTAIPEGGGYVALEYLPGGVESSSFVLTYTGAGHVILEGGGVPLKPTSDQLWKEPLG